MNTIREIEKINQQELDRGIAGTSASWHSQFANSAWCYVGNLDHELTEGDILCIMSQYGEVEDIHLVREEDTGKSRGFAFVKYEDTRSCILAVDNFCGVVILGRSLRVDHVEQYRLPKKLQEREQDSGGEPQTSIDNNGAGHAYKGMEFENKYNIHQGMDLFAAPPTGKDKQHDKKSDGSNEKRVKKLEKMKRKEERQQKRLEKEERRRRREERREKHEEKRQQKRARRDYHSSREDD
jgi:RNA-binding motif X-linked protein 2